MQTKIPAEVPPFHPVEWFMDLASHISAWDWAALSFFVVSWFAYGWFANYTAKRRQNLIGITNLYRRAWMRQMLKRENRMVDASMMGNLMRSISFFANTSILILFGLATLFGYRDKAQSVLESIPFATDNTALLWEIKSLLLFVIFIYAFFKYTWSLRQYNYASIFVGGAPLPSEATAEHIRIAEGGAKLITNAAHHFNMGLRAYYFGLASLSWFIHPVLFILSTAWITFVVYRREFMSWTLKFLDGNSFVEEMVLDAEKSTRP